MNFLARAKSPSTPQPTRAAPGPCVHHSKRCSVDAGWRCLPPNVELPPASPVAPLVSSSVIAGPPFPPPPITTASVVPSSVVQNVSLATEPPPDGPPPHRTVPAAPRRPDPPPPAPDVITTRALRGIVGEGLVHVPAPTPKVWMLRYGVRPEELPTDTSSRDAAWAADYRRIKVPAAHSTASAPRTAADHGTGGWLSARASPVAMSAAPSVTLPAATARCRRILRTGTSLAPSPQLRPTRRLVYPVRRGDVGREHVRRPALYALPPPSTYF